MTARDPSTVPEACDRALHRVFSTLPDDTSPVELDRRLREAYPFRERNGYSYRVWLQRVRRWRTEYAAGVRWTPVRPRRPRPRPTRLVAEELDLFAPGDGNQP